MMVQASHFCDKANEDASTHLQQFLELCSTFVIKRVSQDAIWSFLFWREQSSGSMLTGV